MAPPPCKSSGSITIPMISPVTLFQLITSIILGAAVFHHRLYSGPGGRKPGGAAWIDPVLRAVPVPGGFRVSEDGLRVCAGLDALHYLGSRDLDRFEGIESLDLL